jgi:hypothetical protein
VAETGHFFIAGFPKCGTTSLHEYLEQHPDICMSRPKETYFVAREYEQGAEYFRQRYFAHHTTEQWLGESSPRSVYLEYGPERLHRLFPEARFVVMLRDPAERALSHWWGDYSARHENLPFVAAIEKNLAYGPPAVFYPGGPFTKPRAYLELGQYAVHLKRFLSFFDRSQLCVCWFDDLCSDAAGVVMEVHRFLQLEPLAPADIQPRNYAIGPLWKRLSGYLASKRHSYAVVKLARRTLERLGDRRPEPEAATMAMLRDYFAPFDADLEALLGVAPSWRRP